MGVNLLAAGSNSRGQLANGTADDAHTFTPCCFASPPPSKAHVLDIACGANHTILLLHDSSDDTKSVWVSGDGARGQLGPGAESTIFELLRLPTPLDSLEPVAIAAAWETSYIVLRSSESDMLLSFGGNDFGDLGRGIGASHLVEQVSLDTVLSESTFRITDIASGPRHVLCLVDHGNRQSLVGWGASRHGQLGIRADIVSQPVVIKNPFRDGARIVSIACGNQHSLLLSNDGRVHGLGSNRKGQISEAMTRLGGVRGISCTWNSSFLVFDDAVHAFGSGNHGQLGHEIDTLSTHAVVFLERGIRKVATGSEHILAVTLDGTLFGWGWNEHGNLGLDHTEDVFLPVRLPVHCPEEAATYQCTGAWGGCGTSWLVLE